MPQQGEQPKRNLEFYADVLSEFAFETNATTTRDGPTFLALVEAREEDGTQHALKLDLHRNTYNFQSYAKVSAWTADGWKVIYSIPYPLLRIISQPTSHNVGAGLSGSMMDAMFEDGAQLLMIAERVTGWHYCDAAFTFD